MSQTQCHLEFKVNLSVPLVLALEPSEKHWNNIYGIADSLLQSLSGRVVALHFLGNANAYPIVIPRDFREGVSGWHSENRNRVVLIGPIMEKLEKDMFSGMMVVITSALPVDVEDWKDKDIMRRVLFVRVGEWQPCEDYVQIDKAAGLSGIGQRLCNAVRKAGIKGPGFVPLRYDQDQGRVLYEDGAFCLMVSVESEPVHIHLRALCLSHPMLQVERESGDIENYEGTRESTPWFNDPVWKEIPGELEYVIEAGISKREFQCSQCGEMHAFDSLSCPQGESVLRGLQSNICFLIKRHSYLSLSDWHAVPLSGGRVITREGSLYRLEGGQWRYVRKIIPYEEVDDDVWALFNQI